MEKLFLTFGIIFASLGTGYGVQQAVLRGRLRLPGSLDAVRVRLLRVAMFICLPASAMLSLWGLAAPTAHLLWLPVLGICAWATGGALGVLASRRLRLSREQTGAMFCCGALTNIGAVGGLVCSLFLGEQAIALVALYRMCEEVLFFGIICPVAASFGQSGAAHAFSLRPLLRRLAQDKVLALVIASLALGIGLNAAGVPRFPGAGWLSSAFMVAATVCFLTGIGLGLRLSRLRGYTRQWLSIAAIKFVIQPVWITALAVLAGLGGVDGGLPLRVVFILAAMPVAMNALAPPALFGLDLDLANACWVWTTLSLVLVLPVLLWILPHV